MYSGQSYRLVFPLSVGVKFTNQLFASKKYLVMWRHKNGYSYVIKDFYFVFITKWLSICNRPRWLLKKELHEESSPWLSVNLFI